MSEDLEFKAEDEEDYDEEEVKIPEIKGTKNYTICKKFTIMR